MLRVSSQTNFSTGFSTVDCQFKNPISVGVLIFLAQYILINSIIVPLRNMSKPCHALRLSLVDKIIKWFLIIVF